MVMKSDVPDPPTEFVDVDLQEPASIPPITSEASFNRECDIALNEFTTSITPVIPNPRSYPPLLPQAAAAAAAAAAAETFWTKIIPWVGSLEFILSSLLILVSLYGGDKYLDDPVTFWSHPVLQIRYMSFFPIIVCYMINCSMMCWKHMPDCVFWIKLAILSMVSMCNMLHRAGETRLETLVPTMMVVLLIFMQPIYTQEGRAFIIPTGCLSLIFLYAIVYWGIHNIGHMTNKTMMLDFSVMFFRMCLPFMVTILPVITGYGINARAAKIKHYVLIEATLVVVLIISISIPNEY